MSPTINIRAVPTPLMDGGAGTFPAQPGPFIGDESGAVLEDEAGNLLAPDP